MPAGHNHADRRLPPRPQPSHSRERAGSLPRSTCCCDRAARRSPPRRPGRWLRSCRRFPRQQRQAEGVRAAAAPGAAAGACRLAWPWPAGSAGAGRRFAGAPAPGAPGTRPGSGTRRRCGAAGRARCAGGAAPSPRCAAAPRTPPWGRGAAPWTGERRGRPPPFTGSSRRPPPWRGLPRSGLPRPLPLLPLPQTLPGLPTGLAPAPVPPPGPARRPLHSPHPHFLLRPRGRYRFATPALSQPCPAAAAHPLRGPSRARSALPRRGAARPGGRRSQARAGPNPRLPIVIRAAAILKLFFPSRAELRINRRSFLGGGQRHAASRVTRRDGRPSEPIERRGSTDAAAAAWAGRAAVWRRPPPRLKGTGHEGAGRRRRSHSGAPGGGARGD